MIETNEGAETLLTRAQATQHIIDNTAYNKVPRNYFQRWEKGGYLFPAHKRGHFTASHHYRVEDIDVLIEEINRPNSRLSPQQKRKVSK